MRRYESREARFSNRVLLTYAAAKLPEALALRDGAGGVTEILLYDEIGWYGVTAKDFVLALAQAGDGPVHLRINSPGGDVFDGMAIYNALRAHPAPVTVTVDGIAASAASFIAMAGQTIAMAETSMLMIHNAWGLVIGNRLDMLETAAVMEKIDGQLAAIYAGRSGKPVGDFAAMMDAETWFTASEAQAIGLCTGIVQPVAATAPTAAQASLRTLPRAGLANAIDAAAAAAARARRLRLAEAV